MSKLMSLKKRIYLVSQYDELLAVLVQIYRIRKHESNISHDKGRGAIRADFGPMSEINFVVVTI